MKEFLLKMFAKRFDGYKTYIGTGLAGLVGVGTIITGVVGITAGFFPDLGFEPMTLEEGTTKIKEGCVLIGMAFGAAGIGHKLEKNKPYGT